MSVKQLPGGLNLSSRPAQVLQLPGEVLKARNTLRPVAMSRGDVDVSRAAGIPAVRTPLQGHLFHTRQPGIGVIFAAGNQGRKRYLNVQGRTEARNHRAIQQGIRRCHQKCAGNSVSRPRAPKGQRQDAQAVSNNDSLPRMSAKRGIQTRNPSVGVWVRPIQLLHPGGLPVLLPERLPMAGQGVVPAGNEKDPKRGGSGRHELIIADRHSSFI